MTNRTLTSTTFDAWSGHFHPPQIPVTTFMRAGVSGLGATKGAAQPQRVVVTAQYADTLVNCVSTKTTLEAMEGTFITATDDMGNSYTASLVEAITCTITPCLGDGAALLTCVAVLWPANS